LLFSFVLLQPLQPLLLLLTLLPLLLPTVSTNELCSFLSSAPSCCRSIVLLQGPLAAARRASEPAARTNCAVQAGAPSACAADSSRACSGGVARGGGPIV
jgi:hypothetical protein